jgi:hypothetical protein
MSDDVRAVLKTIFRHWSCRNDWSPPPPCAWCAYVDGEWAR